MMRIPGLAVKSDSELLGYAEKYYADGERLNSLHPVDRCDWFETSKALVKEIARRKLNDDRAENLMVQYAVAVAADQLECD
jgi:hypothetical protein